VLRHAPLDAAAYGAFFVQGEVVAGAGAQLHQDAAHAVLAGWSRLYFPDDKQVVLVA